MLEVFDVSLGHQTSWTGCPYSSLHCQCSSLHCWKTWIWPGWPDGLERNCPWAVFPLSSLDGLERRSRHDIWASNELDSFCRLCCWGPGSCKIIHILIFQSQYQSSTWWGLWLACFGRTGLVLSPWGDADLWLCGLCQTVLFVSLGAWTSLWWIWCILTLLDGLERTVPYAGWPWRISAGDGRSAMMGVSCSWSNALAWALGIHPSSCRHFWPSLPLPRWIHLTDGSGVMMWYEWSQSHGKTA